MNQSQQKPQIPNFVSGPKQRNFNLSAWLAVIAPMDHKALTPDEAIHLKKCLTDYVEYIERLDDVH